MSKRMQKIKSVFGHEPPREGEFPTGFSIGTDLLGRRVARIAFRMEHRGTYGVGYYDALDENGDRIAAITELATSEVHWEATS